MWCTAHDARPASRTNRLAPKGLFKWKLRPSSRAAARRLSLISSRWFLQHFLKRCQHPRETTRSPWTSKRVDEITSMIDRNACIQSPHVNLNQSPVNDVVDAVCQDIDRVIVRAPAEDPLVSSSQTSATPTSSTIFGFARPSRRRSKKPPSMLWTDKENSVNETASGSTARFSSHNGNSGGLRRRSFRSSSGGSAARTLMPKRRSAGTAAAQAVADDRSR